MKHYAIFTYLCFFFIGCNDDACHNNAETGNFMTSTAYMGFPIPDSPWSRYREEMLCAENDDEKWFLTILYLQEDGQTIEDVVADIEKIICYDEMGAPFYVSIWFEMFPGILKYVNFSAEGLWLLAKTYDNDYRPFSEKTFQEDNKAIRIYEYAELRQGEMSRKWVQLMIGKTFANRTECEAWLTQHKGQFHWNKEQGRFDIYENVESMPSTAGTNE